MRRLEPALQQAGRAELDDVLHGAHGFGVEVLVDVARCRMAATAAAGSAATPAAAAPARRGPAAK